MPSSDSRIVRGLSIAVLVLSILALLGFVLCIGVLGCSAAFLTDPNIANQASIALESDPEAASSLEQLGISGSDAVGMSTWALGLFSVLLGVCSIASIVTLIAAIMGMRNYANPQKLGKAFGFSIAGAVMSLLWGNFITMVLLIIMAVYIHRVRNTPAAPAAYGYPGYTYTQPSYSAAVTGYGQVEQPQPQAAPQQPSNPQEPEQK